MSFNLNYEQGNIRLGTTLRNTIGIRNRITKQEQEAFMRLFDGQEAQAMYNNYRAREIGTGFVPQIHYQNLMSGIAPRLQDILVSKIVNNVGIEGPEDNDELVIDKDKPFIEVAYLQKKLYQAFHHSISTGRCTMVVDWYAEKTKCAIRLFDLFRSRIIRDDTDEVIQADLFVDLFQPTAFKEFNLVERRYFNSKGLPCQKHVVVKLEKKEGQNDYERYEFQDVKELPQEIIEHYPNIKLYTEIRLDLKYKASLGVYLIDNSAVNKLYPYTDIPESQFLYIQDKLVAHDTTFTYKETDKEAGRGRVLVPQIQKDMYKSGAMPMGFGANTIDFNFGGGVKEAIFESYPTLSIEDQKPSNVQFNLRIEEWNNDLKEYVAEICAGFGVSVLDFDPRLLQTGQRTDDEINAMTDITRQTAEEKRDLATNDINKMLNCIANLYGLSTPIFIKWSMKSLLNPSKNADLIGKELSNGTISQKTAIKRMNPDYTKREIKEELEAIKGEKEAAKAEAITNSFEQF